MEQPRLFGALPAEGGPEVAVAIGPVQIQTTSRVGPHLSACLGLGLQPGQRHALRPEGHQVPSYTLGGLGIELFGA